MNNWYVNHNTIKKIVTFGKCSENTHSDHVHHDDEFFENSADLNTRLEELMAAAAEGTELLQTDKTEIVK